MAGKKSVSYQRSSSMFAHLARVVQRSRYRGRGRLVGRCLPVVRLLVNCARENFRNHLTQPWQVLSWTRTSVGRIARLAVLSRDILVLHHSPCPSMHPLSEPFQRLLPQPDSRGHEIARSLSGRDFRHALQRQDF